MVLARLALRNLLRHRWRTLATVLGVGLGIAAVLATLAVGDNVRANLRATFEASIGGADLLVTPGATGRAVFVIDEVIAQVTRLPEIASAVPVLNTRSEPLRDPEATGVASLLPGLDSGFQLGGRLTDRPEALPLTIARGRLPLEGAFEVAIGEDFAAGRGIELGEAIGFSTPSGVVEFTLVGLIDDARGLGSTNGGRVGVSHLGDVQQAHGLQGRASHLEVRLREGAVAERVAEQLTELLGDGYAVVYAAGVGDTASGIAQTLQAGLLILAATLLALGGFMAYNTFMAGVVERTREYALLRTICMRRGDVRRLALLEALWVSLAGILLGVLLGVALAWALTTLNAGVIGFEARTLTVPWRHVLAAAAVGTLVALLAGSIPAWTAGRTAPLHALRSVELEPAGRYAGWGWLLIALGAAATQLPWSGVAALFGAALSMAIFFVGVALAAEGVIAPAVRWLGPALQRSFGMAGRLGAGFAVRNARRNGVAIGSVIVSTGLIIGVGSMVEGINRSVAGWLDTTIVGDLFVTSAAPFPSDFAARAAAIPGMDQVSGVGVRAVRFQPEGVRQGRTVAIILVDPARFDPVSGFGRFQYIQGLGDDQVGFETLQRGGALIAANTIMERFGVRPGDEVELRSDAGFERFEIGAVVVDYTGGGETFIGSIADLPRFGGGSPDLFVMTVLPGERPAEVRERLREAFPELLLDVTLNESYRLQVEELINRSFTTTNALLALAAIIAAIGVANTLGMNLARRAHELAVLRALGLRRAGVAALVMAEGVVVLSIGAIMGIGFGLLLADVITAGAEALTGFRLQPHTPVALMAWAALLIPAIGLLASYLPARRAGRLSPHAAIGTSEVS